MASTLREWPDGHQLQKDRFQHIVRHPKGCRNARRHSGENRSAHVELTFLTSMAGLQRELYECGLRLDAPNP